MGLGVYLEVTFWCRGWTTRNLNLVQYVWLSCMKLFLSLLVGLSGWFVFYLDRNDTHHPVVNGHVGAH